MKSEFDFKEILKEESKKIGVELSDEMLIKFEKYVDILLDWNTKMNLTAITDKYEVIMKHIIDSLEIVKYIDRNTKLIDVGTGAGLPGIVIAIFFEGNIEITLLDSLEKRVNFLNEVINKLGLVKVKAIKGRAEELGKDPLYREKYDYSVARAVASLPVLLEFNSPFVKVGGKCLLLKASNYLEEIKASTKAIKVLNCKLKDEYVYNYFIEDEEYKRVIVDIEKIGNTPKGYPRIYGKIKKKPL